MTPPVGCGSTPSAPASGTGSTSYPSSGAAYRHQCSPEHRRCGPTISNSTLLAMCNPPDYPPQGARSSSGRCAASSSASPSIGPGPCGTHVRRRRPGRWSSGRGRSDPPRPGRWPRRRGDGHAAVRCGGSVSRIDDRRAGLTRLACRNPTRSRTPGRPGSRPARRRRMAMGLLRHAGGAAPGRCPWRRAPPGWSRDRPGRLGGIAATGVVEPPGRHRPTGLGDTPVDRPAEGSGKGLRRHDERHRPGRRRRWMCPALRTTWTRPTKGDPGARAGGSRS